MNFSKESRGHRTHSPVGRCFQSTGDVASSRPANYCRHFPSPWLRPLAAEHSVLFQSTAYSNCRLRRPSSNLRYSRPTAMWHLSFPIHSTAEWTVQEKEWTRALAQPARGVLAPLGQRHGFQAFSASLQPPRTITPRRQWRLANNSLRGWKDGCRHCQPTQACWKEDTMPGTRQMTSHPTLRTTQVYTPPPFNM